MLEQNWNNMTSQIWLEEITRPSQQNSTDTEITSKSDLDGRNYIYDRTIYLLLLCQFCSLVKLSYQWYGTCWSISASETHWSIPRTKHRCISFKELSVKFLAILSSAKVIQIVLGSCIEVSAEVDHSGLFSKVGSLLLKVNSLINPLPYCLVSHGELKEIKREVS